MESSLPIAEVPWHLDVNGSRAFSGTFTPGRARDLAAGRLLGEGFVRQPADVRAIDVQPLESGAVRIQATIEPEQESRARAELRHRAEQGCGLRHFVACDRSLLTAAHQPAPPDAGDFAGILRELFAACDARFPDGGVHAAALWDGGLRHQSEDVGRHNAVDRALGAAFLAGDGPQGCGLVLSARISGQMAMVAARAGIAWIASRSVPTRLALEIARAAGLPLIARAGRQGHRARGAGP